MNASEMLPGATSFDVVPDLNAGSTPDELEITAAVRSDACILFSGTPHAKGLALRIHNLSGCRWGSFAAVDCGASEAVLEQQVFKALRAPSQASAGAEPHARLQQSGTLFLYEVGKLSLAMQVRLADALCAAAGPDCRLRARKRIMASTSEALLARVAAGTFDDRLFYRLNAIHLICNR